jgi:hypothetical protein
MFLVQMYTRPAVRRGKYQMRITATDAVVARDVVAALVRRDFP